MTPNMFDALYSFISKKLCYSSAPFFLGGSCRFGYAMRNSDIDIFLYHPDPSKFLSENFEGDFERISSSDYELGGCHYRGFNGNVDFIFLPNLEKFRELELEHERVSAFICSHKSLQVLIKGIKELTSLKGKFFYRILLKMIDDPSIK